MISPGYVEKKTLSRQVAEKMRQEILRNTLPSGSRITIQEIAQRYDTSPLPVREAFKMLEGENLIETIPYKGAVICAVDQRFFENIFDIMTALECLAIDSAIRSWSVELKKKLLMLNEKIMALETDEEILRYYSELNLQFHQLIEQYYNNPLAKEQLAYYRGLVALVTDQVSRGYQRAQQASKEHIRLIGALESGNVNEARSVFFEHAYNSRNAMLKMFFSDQTNI